MANWINRLELKDLWQAEKRGKITLQELGKKVAERIREMKCYEKQKDYLEDIADNFEACIEIEEFDSYLEDLYNWGDQNVGSKHGIMQNKRCWINTITI